MQPIDETGAKATPIMIQGLFLVQLSAIGILIEHYAGRLALVSPSNWLF